MHFPIVLAGITTFASAVAADPQAAQPVGVAIMTVNNPVNGEHSTLPLNVPLGVLTHQADNKITELQIARVYSNSASVKAPDVAKVTCQMYKDQYGTQPASKEFTSEKPGIISKDSVNLGWVLCYVNAQS
ncbi:hypothetical protein FZEAL_8729 [Fusarium zealandicum]|uniref:Uncharacterized protein n=1 Tax=Fusarium zealandicum TaxID=1053134 RepID=A0A8H4UDA7_9HYPO|nr:hypothetical protein FZEAL_8729 [Fusarium zealandicum]